MKKTVLKIFIILVIFQEIICISNTNIVMASSTDDSFSNVESQSDTFSQMGANKISSLGISVSQLTEPLGLALGVVHFLAIALAVGKLLLTLIGILKEDTLDKAKAKKSLTIDFIILFLAIAGVPWAKKIIAML